MLRFILATGLLLALASAATAEDSCDASASTPTTDDDCVVRICTILYCVPTGPVTGTGPGPGPFMPVAPGEFGMLDQRLKLLFNRDQSLSVR